MVAAGLIIGARLFICRCGHAPRELSILAVMCLFIVSNQFYLASSLGDGQKEAEFKFLAQWYVKNTQPDEKLGLYMFGVVQLYVPENLKDNLVPLPKAENPAEFVRACLEQKITYVGWASREGLSTDHAGYRQLNLDKNIAFLREPKNIGPYEFVTQVKSIRGYVNIFRLNLNRDGKN
jgi:hypothetical protein